MTKNECKNPKITLIWKGPIRTDQLLSGVHFDSPTGPEEWPPVERCPSCEQPCSPAPFPSTSQDYSMWQQRHPLSLSIPPLQLPASCQLPAGVGALCGSPGSRNLPCSLQSPAPLQDVPVPVLFSLASDQINATQGFQRLCQIYIPLSNEITDHLGKEMQ